MQPRSPIYLICTTPRSGSNLLCELLESTGVLGRPREYFNGIGRRTFDDPEFPDDPELQMRRAIERGTTPNGVFGLKLFASQMQHALGSATFVRHLDAAVFVHLQREDLLGQAISMVRARQSGQFRAYQPATGAVSYDARAIEHALDDLVTQHAAWRIYFQRCAIPAIEATYDEVVSSPGGIAARLAGAIGIADAVAVRHDTITLSPQSDAQSQEWRARFVAEHGGRGRFEIAGAGQRAGSTGRPHLLERMRRSARRLMRDP